MGYIYCLYSTNDGQPRYVGMTTDTPGRRRKQHLAASLDKDLPGAVHDWIRGVLRAGHMVEVWTIQEDVIPADLLTFEKYWIDQFPNLLNKSASARQASFEAEKITSAIREQLQRERETAR